MQKITTIALPASMIDQIDEMLLSKDFSSRSEFFRHLVRMWFANQEAMAGGQIGRAGQEEKDMDDLIDLEYGIPKGVIKKIEEQAKLLN